MHHEQPSEAHSHRLGYDEYLFGQHRIGQVVRQGMKSDR